MSEGLLPDMAKRLHIVVPEAIERRIFLIRGHKVMLSVHLADLYGVETRVLNQAVKRNIGRFPDDFMFQLTEEESGWLLFTKCDTTEKTIRELL